VFDAVVVGAPSTSGELAARNLDAQIDGLRRAASLDPHREDVAAPLVRALITRAQFFGTWRDFDEALARTEALDPGLPGATGLRAEALIAVHRFDEAAALVQDDPVLHLTVRAARGEDILREAEFRRAEEDTVPAMLSHAHALARAGAFDAADRAYRDAAEAYRDVSPFIPARIAFARGLMWSEFADQPERGKPLYAEAVRRLPGFVTATVHLAELLEPAEAVALLERLPPTVDPEPRGARAELTGDTAELGDVAEAYRALTRTMPEAVWDHAAEFFMGPGSDPAFALQLALRNLSNRNTERAWLVALEAAVAARDEGTLEALLSDAPDAPAMVPLAERLQALRP
jgi:tetratricopeptide (TPR) repeat protein